MTGDSITEQAARAIESQIPTPPPRHADVDPQREQRTAEFRRGMQYAANIVRAITNEAPATEDEALRVEWGVKVDDQWSVDIYVTEGEARHAADQWGGTVVRGTWIKAASR